MSRTSGSIRGWGLVALAWAALLGPVALGAERPTEAFRREHVEVRKHLGHVRTWVGELPKQKPAQQRETAQRVVSFFQKDIRPHAAWEERVLYPLVDRLAGGGPHPFTATMRHEHRVVERWMDELAKEAAKPRLDASAFARRTDNLLGLLDAHFESEEEVLLPLIDKAMTREQFEKETGGASTGHP